MTITVNKEEVEALIGAIKCSHLPDKVHLQGVLKQLNTLKE